MSGSTEDFFDIGVIVNVHGLRGDIKVMPVTDEPKRFELLDEINVYYDNKNVTYKIKNVRYHKTVLVLSLEGVDDRITAEQLKGGVIKISRKNALLLEPDEYFQKDLYDMTVFTETGENLGTITNIIETGANDVYVVTPLDKSKDLMIPAIKQCIKDISLSEKRMTVSLMKGLREL